MSLLDPETIRRNLPPWVVLMLGLLALNALAPTPARSRKSDPSETAGLTIKDDCASSQSRATDTTDLLSPVPLMKAGLILSVCRIPVMESDGDLPPNSSPNGEVRGRAPPSGAVA
jgi:hypothetical protein